MTKVALCRDNHAHRPDPILRRHHQFKEKFMLRDDAITLIATRMTRSNITADALVEMQLAQSKLESQPFLPWFLLTETSTSSTTAYEERVASLTSITAQSAQIVSPPPLHQYFPVLPFH